MKSAREKMDMVAAYYDVGSFQGAADTSAAPPPRRSSEPCSPTSTARSRPSGPSGPQLRRGARRHGQASEGHQGPHLGQAPAARGSRRRLHRHRSLVRILHRGQVIKVRPRQAPGRRSTDPDDLPDKTVYAIRDLDRLRRMAAEHGPAIAAYASALLDIPLPWTKMRQVYALNRPGIRGGSIPWK
jgi:hypothetical protein